MFDFVNERKRIVQAIMAIATLPFLFWGIESYRNTGSEDYVAIVTGEKIQRQEFDQALRNQQENMRNSPGEKINDAMIDNPEIRLAVVEKLILQRLFKSEVAGAKLTVTDSQLVEVIQGIPAFQQDGKFSNSRYEEILRNQGMTPVIFESRVRQDMMQQQLTDAFTQYGFVSDTVAHKIMRLSEEKREINQIRIQPEQFLSQIKPSDASVESYYKDHQNELQLPEQVRVEYLVLSLDDLIKKTLVSSDEAIKYYDEHKSEFDQTEERQASHILFNARVTASDQDKEIARSKAKNLLDQIKQSPKSFADFAGQHSQDPGTANKGGDLGFFGRGIMVKSFEDEIFQMKPEEIRGPIQTDFGFHIVKLTSVRAGKSVNYADIKNQVEQELKKQKAGKIFGEVAESFGNMVYEQGDNLRPAAEKFKLSIQESGWINKKVGEAPYLTDEKLLNAIFSEEVIKNKHNTESIEVKPNTLISARVVGHKPVAIPSITIVKDKINKILVRHQAIDYAKEEGKKRLAQLQAGEKDTLTWGPVQQVSRREPQGLDNETLRSVFKAESVKLPSYEGLVDSLGGFSLIRISKVMEPLPVDKTRIKDFGKQLQQLISQEELLSYLAAIKQRSEVTIRKENIERRQ